MRRWIFYWMGLVVCAGLACAQQTEPAVPGDADAIAIPAIDQDVVVRDAVAAIDSGNLQQAEERVALILHPAARLTLEARIAQARGNPREALRKAAEVAAFHYRDATWLPQAEWLCALLYEELDMPEAALVTARQIQRFHPESEFSTKADALRRRIEGDSSGTPQ